MADNGRWFKVWTSILVDVDMADLSLEDVGRWALLGALVKSAGTNGVLHINGTGRRVCELLRVPDLDAAREVLSRLPNVLVTEHPLAWRHGRSRPPTTVDKWSKSGMEPRGKVGLTLGERHGGFFVTFKNWRKYQVDSTAAERGKTLRSKKRRDERREKTPVVTREVETSRAGALQPEDPESVSHSDLGRTDRREDLATLYRDTLAGVGGGR